MVDLVLTEKTLDELEVIIDENIEGFYKAGLALAEVKNRKLWVGAYESFAQYCDRRWGFKESNAYHLIASSTVVANLPEPPQKAAHTIPLQPLTPENQRLAWAEVTASGNDVTTAQVQAVATRYRLIEAVGDTNWLVRQVNGGVYTANFAWEGYRRLTKLPAYYQQAINKHRVMPASQVLDKLRRMEYAYADEVGDILLSGCLDTGKEQIPLGELTVRDLERLEARLYYENLRLQEMVAVEEQKAGGLPIFDGAEIFDLHGELVYLFPDSVNDDLVIKTLGEKGYRVFMVLAYKGKPFVNFDENGKKPITQVNGVKPEPIMELIKAL